MSWSCVLVLLVALAQVHADDAGKRNLGSVARARMLPVEGKRYVAALARNGDLPYFAQRQYNKKLHPMVFGGGFDLEKRYVGALARGGGLPFASRETRADEAVDKIYDLDRIDDILHDIENTEESLRSQIEEFKLEALKLEVDELQDGDKDPGVAGDDAKRSAIALARNGNMPFRSRIGKRNVEALARAGYLPVPKEPQSNEDIDAENSEEDNRMGKRSIASLAASGQFQYPLPSGPLWAEDKRGGVESLARNGYLHADEPRSLDGFIKQLYDQESYEKRNIGSLARSFSLPSGGKRNLGSFARSGGFSAIRNTPSKKDDEDDSEGNEAQEDEKRNLGSFARTRQRPLEGKRHLASALRGRSFVDEEVKRHVGSMARGNLLPFGKRFEDGAEAEVESAAERYAQDLRDVVGDLEEKRHIASLASSGRQLLHKKSSRSTGSDVAAYHSNDTSAGEPPRGQKTKRSAGEGEDHAAVTAREGAAGRRTKRQSYFIPLPPSELSDEYPMPVIQNSDLFDYDDVDVADLLSEGAPSKRFLGSVARTGWPVSGSGGGVGGAVAGASGDVAKRHIGSLARLGWLPAFRSIRTSRNGKRSVLDHDRTDTADGPQEEAEELVWSAPGRALPLGLTSS